MWLSSFDKFYWKIWFFAPCSFPPFAKKIVKSESVKLNLGIFHYSFQCTEHESEDREDLIEAVNIMADVAAFINESKRRKDIVDKYKTEEEKTLTRKISKLNMHSIGKKSTRIGQRFLSSIGIESSVSTSQTNTMQ